MPKRSLQIFNSDQVNRAKIRVTASALMEAEENHLAYVIKHGLPRGLPMNFQHDLTRLAGWSATLGHFIDGSMVRVVGLIAEPETAEEWAQVKEIGRRYWECHHSEGMESLRAELSQRVAPEVLDAQGTEFLRVETCVAVREGLAAKLYPHLFDVSTANVDKDGLVDYAYLLTQVKVVAPGIFLDEERQLVLFAHRFFRRSQSHLNKLNEYFLDSFSRTAKDKKVGARLRLDPDRVGHPEGLKDLVEFEYWHGPRYSDDIASIPSGAATHKASQGTRQLEGVDKTQFWWKSPETRPTAEGATTFRTLELEELRDIPSLGLPAERYGCRYAHAEYALNERCVSHFDGAIRAYPVEKYLERIERNIDRAGKHSEYTKLFRFDGSLPVGNWKRLLSDYFRGNPLVPEYLGAPTGNPEEERTVSPEAGAPAESSNELTGQDRLCVFIRLQPGHSTEQFVLALKTASMPDGETKVRFMETGIGAVDKLLRERADLSMVASMYAPDGQLELVPMVFGASSGFPASMYTLANDLREALVRDVSGLGLTGIALTFVWPQGDLLTSLSIRGASQLVLKLLSMLFSVVDATKPASDWIEALAAAVRMISPQSDPDLSFHGVLEGRLAFERDEMPAELMFPELLAEELKSKMIGT